ncbi:MAG TPA: glycerate kinase [Bryobacteraceae bacterium]|nr:glycerate kinase [Bryobacteraceae bacterium]
MNTRRKHALQIFRAALAASDPQEAVLRHLKFDGRTLTAGKRKYALSKFDRIQVIGAGKASASMARAMERLLGRRIAGGWINVKDGHAAHLRRIHQHECGHPIPDERGVEGTRRMAGIASNAGPRDLLIAVISGGASALTPAPVSLTLAEKQDLTRTLLACGATIHEINTVRKHLSSFKGGQLARLTYPATTIALIFSDVIGDDLDVIGSGPTVPDRSTIADARAVMQKYGIVQPVQFHETPKPGDVEFTRVQNLIVGSNAQAIDAAYLQAKELGYKTMVLSTRIEGETRDVAGVHAAIAKEILASGRPLKTPACILSGGETTVTLRGSGKGGRNQEFVLAAAIALAGAGEVTVLSAGTDGTDGPTDAAGAIADSSTVERAREMGLDAPRFLAENDSYHFFEKIEGLIKTGPTGTNVMDVRVVLA